KVDTGLIEREKTPLGAWVHQADLAGAARAVEFLIEREQVRIEKRARKRSNEKSSPWNARDAFGFNPAPETNYAILVDGAEMSARVRFDERGVHTSINGTKSADCAVFAAGDSAIAWNHLRQTKVALADPLARLVDQTVASGAVLAPMHGKV